MRFLFLVTTIQPTKQITTDTSKPGGIMKPVFVVAFVALLTAFAIYYFVAGTRITRETGKELTTEGLSLSEEAIGTQVTERQDAGITHEAFVGDSDEPAHGSTNVTAPEPEVKVAENADSSYELTSF